ncbi:RICIN domain-containing protein [Streptomyces sp. NPDC001941]|uniref:RICIN domain-containing protein n=1 Tax=Streptomyces sp. NPDC001941 TaxID=3154659 RepID=UPI0033282BE2
MFTTRRSPTVRLARAFGTAATSLLLPATLLVGVNAGTAVAAPGDELVRTSTDSPDRFKIHPLNRLDQYTKAISAMRSSPGITPLSAPLDQLKGTGHQGKTGLCYPAAFHPGIAASGYCWDNEDDATGGPNGWTPQGLSPKVDQPNWQVASWHSSGNKHSRLTFVDRSGAAPRYNHVLLVVPGGAAKFSALEDTHADSIVWKGDRLLMGTGRSLHEFLLTDLMRVNTLDKRIGVDAAGNASALYHNYILPVRESYWTPDSTSEDCTAGEGTLDVPGNKASGSCLTSLSYSDDGKTLVSSEYMQNKSGGRIIQWPEFATGGTATATRVWRSPVYSMQGALLAEGHLFISGKCPDSFDNGGEYRIVDGKKIPRENACIHKAVPGGKPSVLTAVPDMSQNLGYDPVSKRIWGISERWLETRNRLVFSVNTTPTPITAVRFKNIGSNKCLTPYGALIKSGITQTQWECNGKSPQNWYWDGKTIRNFSSRLCLTVNGGSDSNGARITQWTCNGSPYQDWTLRRNSAGGGAQIVSVGSNLCLTSDAGSPDNGAEIVQWACNPDQIKHSWNGG